METITLRYRAILEGDVVNGRTVATVDDYRNKRTGTCWITLFDEAGDVILRATYGTEVTVERAA